MINQMDTYLLERLNHKQERFLLTVTKHVNDSSAYSIYRYYKLTQRFMKKLKN